MVASPKALWQAGAVHVGVPQDLGDLQYDCI